MINLQRGTPFFLNIVFALFVILACGFYFGVEKTELGSKYIEWHTQTASSIMNQMLGEKTTIHTTATALKNEIRTDDVAWLRIDSINYAYLTLGIIAAIIAWPSNSKVKKTGFLIGSILLGPLLHLLHSILLLEFAIWWPLLSSFAENIALPMILIGIWLIYFLIWIRYSASHPNASAG